MRWLAGLLGLTAGGAILWGLWQLGLPAPFLAAWLGVWLVATLLGYAVWRGRD